MVQPPQDESNQSSLKFWLLVLLVIQGSFGILTGRFTRVSVPEEDLYEISHLVLVIELVKLVLSTVAECIATKGAIGQSINEHILQNPFDCAKVMVPSVLYVIQGSLIYIALSNLEAPIFISLQQGKLIATALVSVTMLNRSYSWKQWGCLFVLALGVAIVALDERPNDRNSEDLAAAEFVDEQSEQALAEAPDVDVEPEHFLVGLIAVTGACFSSAFAGVYFEKVLAPEKANFGNASNKKLVEDDAECREGDVLTRPQKSRPSLWIRNMQLAFFSLIFAYLQGIYEAKTAREATSMHAVDKELNDLEEDSKPYLHGFNGYVWLLVGIQAFGGLLVAAVMKYADNVLKGLAMGVAVVVASAISTVAFDVKLSGQFWVGASTIIASVYCFSNSSSCSCAERKNTTEIEMSIAEQSETEGLIKR